MNRNLVLISLAVIILLVTIRYDVNYLAYKSPMPYKQWNEITWSDFKGLKIPFMTLYGGDKFAFIATEIKVEKCDDRWTVISYFHPSRSYVFNQNTYDNALLQHELYHFHITESVARMLRREIALSGVGSGEDLSKIISKYQQKEDSLQIQYDTQTYHGFVLNQQKKWQRTTDSCLLALAEYTNL